MGASEENLIDRDPNDLNSHVRISHLVDIIGEPDGLHSPDCCWKCSISCFDKTRHCCYVFLVILFAPFIAFCSGCQFACLAFHEIWCVGPCLRIWKINLYTVRRFWSGYLLAICGPCAEVMGLYFSKIKVRYQMLAPGKENDAAAEYFNA